jgi:UDP-glucose 4-epimerase
LGAVLVTGGLGYVGRHLVARLAGEGREVVSYNRDFVAADEGPVRNVQGELYDLPRLVRALEEHSVERIVHTAAMSHPELSVEMPIGTFAANVEGTLHVFEAARMAGVTRIVCCSSESAYGHVEGLVREDARLRPTTPYGVSKAACEMLADVYCDIYGLDPVSLRITEIYGPGNKMPQYLKGMILAAHAGRPYRLEHGAGQGFHFIRVEDVVEAMMLALDAERVGQRAYNVTGGEQLTLAQAAEIVREALPGAQIELGAGPVPGLDVQGPFDISAARRDLGYEPRWSPPEGIGAYARWLADNDHLEELRCPNARANSPS